MNNVFSLAHLTVTVSVSEKFNIEHVHRGSRTRAVPKLFLPAVIGSANVLRALHLTTVGVKWSPNQHPRHTRAVAIGFLQPEFECSGHLDFDHASETGYLVGAW